MSRNILLVEPNYKIKFPPLGLMKISAYHKTLGDKVVFVKGFNSKLAYEYWDRIYVTTLFTYNWKITVDTINQYKALVGGDTSRILVGGILASLMPEEVWRATGIAPHQGVLSSLHTLDDDNELIVDQMTPDYELFNDAPHNYTLVDDSYFGYSTRGCVHKCDFCGVHRIEPKFVEYQGLKPYVNNIIERYGERAHLSLFDNNILASQKFEQIINDIIDLGFKKGAKFGPTRKSRKVDFNQGTDARLMTEEHARLLSQIAINPLRIAFDSIKFKKIYSDKIKLAAKYGIANLSNYILYNHKDTPEDFWQRLKINIDLNSEYNLNIYSFPMKYIPLMAKDRNHISTPNWNWYFVRGVQRILNVMKGSVMPGEDFFYRAFGESEKEFLTILHMPEKILMSRSRVPQKDELEWKAKFARLTLGERKELLEILSEGRTRVSLLAGYQKVSNRKIKSILDYYLPENINNFPLFEV